MAGVTDLVVARRATDATELFWTPDYPAFDQAQNIYRSQSAGVTPGGSQTTQVASVGAQEGSYVDDGLASGAQYYYVIESTRSGGSAVSNEAEVTTGQAWTRVQNPTPDDGGEAAFAQGSVYIHGGNDFARYDSQSQSFTSLPSPSDQGLVSGGAGFASVDGELYAFGGDPPGNFNYSPEVYRWTPGGSSWDTSVANMPQGRKSPGGVGYDGSLYVYGGSAPGDERVLNDFRETNSLWRYDPGSDSWTVLTGGPKAVFETRITAVNGKLYVIGARPGNNDPPSTGANQIYDIANDSWTQGADYPNPEADDGVQKHGLTTDGKYVYVIGGIDNVLFGPTFDEVYQYDPDTDSWILHSRLPTTSKRLGGTHDGSTMYAGDGYVRIYNGPGPLLTGVNDLTVTANAATNPSTIDLSWTPEDNAASQDIYRAQSSGSTVGDYTKIADVSDSTSTYTDTGLEDGEKYFYRIQSHAPRRSELGTEDSAVTNLPAVAAFSVTVGNRQADLDWNNADNSSDGYYEVYRRQDNTVLAPVTRINNLATTAYTDTGLEDGAKYYYTVRRVTDHTFSETGVTSGVTDLPTPTLDDLTGLSQDSIKAEWSRTDNSTDGTIQVMRSQDPNTVGSPVVTLTDLSVDSYIDTVSKPNFNYVYAIRRTTDHAQVLSLKESTSGAPPVIRKPDNISVTATGGVNEVSISWENNDEVTSGFIAVFRSTVQGTTGTEIFRTTDLSRTGYTDSGLDPTQDYYYTVVRESGTGATAESVQVQAPGFAPPAKNVEVSRAGEDTFDVLVEWDRTGTQSGGEWRIYRSPTQGTLGSQIGTVGTISTTQFTDTGAPPGTTLFYTVRRAAPNGTVSATSASNTGTTVAPVLQPPGNPVVSVTNGDQLDISWADLATNNDAYRVYVSADGGSTFTQVGPDLPADATSYTTPAQADGEVFVVEVRAVDSQGTEAAEEDIIERATLTVADGTVEQKPTPYGVAGALHVEGTLEIRDR